MIFTYWPAVLQSTVKSTQFELRAYDYASNLSAKPSLCEKFLVISGSPLRSLLQLGGARRARAKDPTSPGGGPLLQAKFPRLHLINRS